MLDREQVHKVALLARLELTPDEEEQYAKQMSSILDYFEQLSELDTKDVEPTTRAIDMSNITRHDEQLSYQNLAGIYDLAIFRAICVTINYCRLLVEKKLCPTRSLPMFVKV
jgi:aspartyl-tRNA(Asn)/glutamyl-tRNA(Gln) amidotransferase subunit C